VVNGVVGKALSFDGSNDAVSIGLGGLVGTTPKLTVSAWINVKGGENTLKAIVSDTVSQASFHFQLDTDNKLQVYFYGPSRQPFSTTLFNSANFNKWFYGVGVWDGTYGRIYVNGIQEGITSAGSGSIAAPYNMFIGEGFNLGRFFNGLIDDVRIYNRALSAGEVMALYLQSYCMFPKTKISSQMFNTIPQIPRPLLDYGRQPIY